TVAERDNRDPAPEVQVLAAIGVPHTAAVAVDDGEIGACVRRQEPLERGRRHRHATTAVSPISAVSPARAAWTAAMSLGTIPPSEVPDARKAGARTGAIQASN